jgi:hypothetical protein
LSSKLVILSEAKDLMSRKIVILPARVILTLSAAEGEGPHAPQNVGIRFTNHKIFLSSPHFVRFPRNSINRRQK